MEFKIIAMVNYREYKDLDLENVPFFIPQRRPAADVQDKNKSILDVIFALDPRTNLPMSDIQQFLSDGVNDEVRQFIQKNIMRPQSSVGQSSQLSMDDAMEFVKRPGESFNDYRDRLTDIVHQFNQSKIPKSE